MAKRSLISLLPAYNQTDTLKKFFGATVDELFQPGSPQSISGYVGSKPSYYNSTTDFYISEPTTERSFYQLEPGMVSYDSTGSLSHSLVYPDLVAYLNTSGAITSNEQRMFENDYYVWAPPINVDMLTNYTQYYWFGDKTGSAELPILTLTSPSLTYTGDGVTTTFALPASLQGTTETPAAYVHSLQVSATVVGNNIVLDQAPASGMPVYVTRLNDLAQAIIGQTTFSTVGLTSTSVTKLTTGMRIQLDDGLRINNGYDLPPYDTTPFNPYPDIVFMVDGVGRSIRLTPDTTMIRGMDAQYITIERGSLIADAAPWSNANNWIHFDAFAWANTTTGAGRQATRPIIEFVRDMIMYPNQTWQEQAEPLFMLYDVNGVALNNGTTYPNSNFTGSRIFGFATGTGSEDSVLKKILSFDANGYITFTNDISSVIYSNGSTAINGLYAYGVLQSDGNTVKKISEWSPASTPTVQSVDTTSGLFSIPKNLVANPASQDVDTISQSEWTDHFTSILKNQTGFTGKVFSSNNWRDSARNMTLGTSILQHVSPLLKTMLLNSEADFDVIASIVYADREYTRFRNLFAQKIKNLYHTGVISPSSDSNDTSWVSPAVIAALKSLKLAKSASFPFALSTMGGGNYFIPPTPSFLGILPCVTPAIITDSTYTTPVTMIRGHDGSLTPSFGDWRDAVFLGLEEMIYSSISSTFKTGARPRFDIQKYVGNAFVGTPTNGYSWEEATSLLNPSFLLWSQTSNSNYRNNAIFDQGNPFTWNYSSVQGFDGNQLPGNWRAIYRLYFDTETPHLTPWEMLGFAEEPSWWNGYYGAAPYASTNSTLWNDIASGTIRAGVRAGVDTRYVRTGLMSVLPVDASGNLLDPVTAKIAPYAPKYIEAKADWNLGDGSPAETFWRNTPSYRFALAKIAYLMKPARFIEECWDTLQIGYLGNQWVDLRQTYFGERPQNSTQYVHGEVGPSGTLTTVVGFQQWISDYLAISGKNPSALGKAVRGLDVRLMHRMAGYVVGSSMNAYADNFGLIPSEDVQTFFYKSPALSEESYSGVIIEWVGNGWRVIGYDDERPYFNIIPPDTSGAKGSISVANTKAPVINAWGPNTYFPQNCYVSFGGSTYQCLKTHMSGPTFQSSYWMVTTNLPSAANTSVVTYINGLNTTGQILYGTVLATRQNVADFLLGYERWLVSRGWTFDNINPSTNLTSNWSQAVLDFLNWSQVDWKKGNFIALSPGYGGLTFNCPTGTITNVEDYSTGFFGLLDRNAKPIERGNANIARLDSVTTIAANNADIYFAKLRICDLEHALIFSNTTIFNDTIYLPLYDMRQSRLRLIGSRASDWAGRLDAPGYIINGGSLQSNFEKTPNDIRLMFDIELGSRDDFRSYARHVLGFQERDYLASLMLSDTEQFEFWQGMIQQKGAPGAFEKLLRSQQATEGSSIEFLEEWAIRNSAFGAPVAPRATFDFQDADEKRDPQYIRFNAMSNANDDWMIIPSGDQHWVDPIASNGSFFPSLGYTASAFPTAGPVRLSEVDYTSLNYDGLNDLYTTFSTANDIAFAAGTKTWIYSRLDGTYDVLQSFDLGSSSNLILTIQSHAENSSVSTARIIMTSAHGLTSADVGNYIVIDGSTGSSPDLIGMQQITSVDPSTHSFQISTILTSGIDFTDEPTTAPIVRVLRSIRFSNNAALAASVIPFSSGSIAYIDSDNANVGNWAVRTYNGSSWVIARQQPQRVDTKSITGVMLYDAATKISKGSYGLNTISANNPLVTDVAIIDPYVGALPGVAAREIDFITESDPAQYNSSYVVPGNVWGVEQVGRVWWNLSTVFYLDAYTDIMGASNQRDHDEITYRSTNWATIAPGTSVDIYEWVESDVDPITYTSKYSGTPYSGNAPEWSQFTKIDPSTGISKTYYYFWVSGLNTIPDVSFRKSSVASVAENLTNPTASGMIWMTPISNDGMLIGGLAPYLNNTSSTLTVKLKSTSEDTRHDQYVLMRSGDESSLPQDWLWRKMRDSLAAFDDKQRVLPFTSVHSNRATGIYDGQNMFQISDAKSQRGGLMSARFCFVGTVSYLLSQEAINSTRVNYISGLSRKTPVGTTVTVNSQETVVLSWTRTDDSYIIEPPPVNEYQYEVHSYRERNALLAKPAFVTAAQNSTNISVLVNGLDNATPQWSIWTFNGSTAHGVLTANPSLPAAQALSNAGDTLFSLATAYEKTVATLSDLTPNGLALYDRVLVENVPAAGTSGFWAIYKYDPFSQRADQNGFILWRVQSYDTSDFFSNVDWYATGYTVNNSPQVIYSDENARDLAEGTKPQNTFVLIENSIFGSGWCWTVYETTTDAYGNTASGWSVVASENGTIALSNAFYDQTRVVHGVNSLSISDWASRDGSWELRVMLQYLRHGGLLLDLEINKLFFSMISFLHTQQNDIDWCFKTSFMTLGGYNVPLSQTPVQQVDETENLIAYINEVKPYRVKVRDYTTQYSPEIDQNAIEATDFDFPAYYDTTLKSYRVLSLSNENDLAIIQSTRPWSDWYNAYLNNPSLLRTFDISMLFNRVDDNNVDDIGIERVNAYYNFPTNSGATVSGNILTQSYAAGQPEERLALALDDGLILRVTNSGRPGSPVITSNAYAVANLSGPTATLFYGNIAQSNQAVLVYRDGVKATMGTDYTVDHLGRTATVNISGVTEVLIQTFGFGGTSPVIEEHLTSYTGSPITLTNSATTNQIEMVVNGANTTDFTLSGHTLSLNTPPTTGSDVVSVVYQGGVSTACNINVQTLDTTTGPTFTLSHPDTVTVPAHAGTIVEKNGLRLTPPRTTYGHISPSKPYVVLDVNVNNGSQVDVYVNNTLYGAAIPYCTSVSQTPNGVPFGVVIPAGQTPSNSVSGQFIIYQNKLIALDRNFDQDVIVVVHQNHDYEVSNGAVTILASYSSSDVISVTTFSNAGVLGIQTSTGVVSGLSLIASPTPYTIDYSWVTVAGKKIAGIRDYDFDYIYGNAQIVSSDGSTMLSAPMGAFYLVVPNSPSGVVVATVFTGSPAHEPASWQNSTVTPAHIRMPVDLNDGTFDNGRFGIDEFDIQAPRSVLSPYLPSVSGQLQAVNVFSIPGTIQKLAVATQHSGVLATKLNLSDTSISITTNSTDLSSKIAPASAFATPTFGNPGVVWIGNERIEYTNIAVNGLSVTLAGLTRQTAGTSATYESRALSYYNGDGSTSTFAIVGQGTPDVTVNHVPVPALTGYSWTYTGTVTSIQFTTPPAAGAEIIIGVSQMVSSYAAGTVVVDGSIWDDNVAPTGAVLAESFGTDTQKIVAGGLKAYINN